MGKKEYKFAYEVYDSINDLPKADAELLKQARKATKNAYAPYSNFNVAAAVRLSNKKIVTATNQENASYPVSICAERVLLSTISSLSDKPIIDTMAISYHNLGKDGKGKTIKSNTPVSPCGMCRQALKEHEERTSKPVRLILSGMEGKVFVIEKASQLLPLGFSPEDLL